MDSAAKRKELEKKEPLFGAWHIVDFIGAGSFGQVFEIQREEFGRTYRSVLKVISIPQSEEDVKMMLTEGTDMSSVSSYYDDLMASIVEENAIMFELRGNTNIVSYEDHTVIPHDDGIGYDVLIRMEKLTPLIDTLLEKEMTEKDVLKLGADLCQALIICQKKNIIHRDIKPANIFISDTGDYKLGDFGIARTIENATSELSKKGTFAYMAPEVYQGKSYGAKADIYSLGVVMYHMLNYNRAPFLPAPPQPITASMKEDARQRRLFGDPLPKPAKASQIMSRIILKACAYRPEDRYETAAEMRKDLIALQRGELDKITAMAETEAEKETREDLEDRTELLTDVGLQGKAAADGASREVPRPGQTADSQPQQEDVPWYQRGSAPHQEKTVTEDLNRTVPDTGHDGRSGGQSRSGGQGRTAGDGGQTRRKPAPAPKAAPQPRWKIIALTAAIVIVFGFAGFMIQQHLRTGGGDSAEQQNGGAANTELTLEDLKIKDFDVNFSQIDQQDNEILEDQTNMSFEDNGVDVLMKIKNKGSKPLKQVKFSMTIDGGKVRNLDKDNEVFTASGYIKGGKTGYMCAKAKISNDYWDDHPNTELELIEIPDGGSGYVDGNTEYELQHGTMEDRSEKSDTYAFRLNGKSDREIHKGAYLVAINKDKDKGLAEYWAGGQLDESVDEGEKCYMKKAFYNPGLKDSDPDDYDVLVIDPIAIMGQ